MKHFKGKSLRDTKKSFSFTFYNKSAYKRLYKQASVWDVFSFSVFSFLCRSELANTRPLTSKNPSAKGIYQGVNQPVTALQSCLM